MYRSKICTLPDSVKTIGYGAFTACEFTSFDMGDGVVTLGESALSACYKLTDLHLSSNLKVIGEGAFRECTSLKTVTIPDGVTVIDYRVFQDCSTLVAIVIPESVEKIKCSFYGSYKFKTIYYRGSEEQWQAIKENHPNDDLFNRSGLIVHYNYSR